MPARHHQASALVARFQNARHLLGTECGRRDVANNVSIVIAWLKKTIGDLRPLTQVPREHSLVVDLNSAAVVNLTNPLLFGSPGIKVCNSYSASTNANDRVDSIIGFANFPRQRLSLNSQLDVTNLLRCILQLYDLFLIDFGWSDRDE
jgi:hypothetical protein